MSIHTASAELPRPMTAPASLHPGVVERHFLRDPYSRERVSDVALEAIEGGMAFAHEQCKAILDARQKILNNQMETPMKRQQQVAALTERGFTQATKKIDSVIQKVANEVSEIEKHTFAPKPAANVADNMLHAEIRSSLAVMSREKRQEALADAIGNGEDEIISAALSGPALLTGLSPIERDALRQTWRQKRFPAELDRLKRIKKAEEDLMRGVDSLFGFRARIIPDPDSIAKAEASERAANEVLKKAIP